MPEAQQWYKMKERAAGEKRLLFMWYVYKFAGKKAVCFLTFFVCLCTFLSSKQVRNYARRNLTVISDYCKANGKKVINPVIFNCFKNVFNFALTLVDNMEIFAGDYDVEKIYFDTEDNKKQFFIPRGFAHGFLVLSDEAVFTYKVDNVYAPQHEASIRFDDAELGIDWPMRSDEILTSKKDLEALPFRDAEYFD